VLPHLGLVGPVFDLGLGSHDLGLGHQVLGLGLEGCGLDCMSEIYLS